MMNDKSYIGTRYISIMLLMLAVSSGVADEWVINEIHADPNALIAGDANRDGARHFGHDEFVEIVNNTGAAANISAWRLIDRVRVRHIFPAGTIVPDQCAVVVFGGGMPNGMFGGAIVQTAGKLALNNSGDTIILNDGRRDRAVYTYEGEGNSNQSLTRVPDISGTGPLVRHASAQGAGGALYSPGTRTDGSPFPGCGNGPIEVNLPLANAADWERYKGMLIRIPQTLTVSGSPRPGFFDLSAGGRLFVPANAAVSGTGAVQAMNERRRVILDYAQASADPAASSISDKLVRAGYTLPGLTGTVSRRSKKFQIQAAGSVNFIATNARTAFPAPTGGTLKIAGFNVKNYFNGDAAGLFSSVRGARSADEFRRQRDKIIRAIVGMDADIIGLTEIENDGYGANSAIQDLVNGLNEAAAPGTYAFVKPGLRRGLSAIKADFIYRPDTAAPIGATASTQLPPFDKRRSPLAQSFEEIAGGGVFTVALNHFKSRKCYNAEGKNKDHGQACWNRERTRAAKTLTAWLAGAPTGIADTDVLIIGDLNAYAGEDPVTAIKAAGYTDLVDEFTGANAYSYLFFSHAGYLDHALASRSLMPQITGVTIWHINADELFYRQGREQQNAELYNYSVYQSSDHDPVIIGLNLSAAE
ncbi:MAG: ExeM/NucH family extracellular endonuclease [Gammaproteobacteria bacterium]|nr:ExeM/NucH family extracellular endonuclease [Gammaproteobacteria bacterium]